MQMSSAHAAAARRFSAKSSSARRAGWEYQIWNSIRRGWGCERVALNEQDVGEALGTLNIRYS